MKTALVRAVATTFLVSALAACGGGGGGGGLSLNPDSVQSLTGNAPPTFTRDSARVELERIAREADAQILTDILFDRQVDGISRLNISCSGPVCRVSVGGISDTFSLFDADTGETTDEAVQPIGEKRGAKIAETVGRTSSAGITADMNGYGAWLVHSQFLATRIDIVGADYGELRGVGMFAAGSVGDESRSSPPGGAEWLGILVGVDVSNTSTQGNFVQGDAALRVDNLLRPRVDVDFTDMVDVKTGTRHRSMAWRGLPLSGPRFLAGSDGNMIQGTFYGSRHQEVGGVFERNRIVGAFGATR